ncbi:ABC transporter permease [Paenibacillaceae bacterium WGS1546]|uniref:ABC transporter permease n=1 Tax=Cohnella sp. WGS1546 TaxID=3366810 RepID=UPI00372D2B35
MVNFANLILNENMKIYRRLRTWIMLAFIVLLPSLISLGVYLGGASLNNWSMMMTGSYISFSLITVFTVVVAADIVAGEFTWGTIKLLLIRPWSRSAILLSKYLATMLFALLFTVAAFIVTFLSNVLIFGYETESVLAVGTSNWEHVLTFYLLQFVTLVIIVTFGFTMSAAFRSGSLAIGLSIFFLFAGQLITSLFALADKAWVKYVLFVHLDLTSYMNGGQGPIPNHPMSLGFSLAVLAAYFVLFNAISWTVFRKRDIAA